MGQPDRVLPATLEDETVKLDQQRPGRYAEAIKLTRSVVRDAGKRFVDALSVLSLKSRPSRGCLSPAQGVEIVEDAGRIPPAHEPQPAPFLSHGTPVFVGRRCRRARAPRTTSPAPWRRGRGHRRGTAASALPPRPSP